MVIIIILIVYDCDLLYNFFNQGFILACNFYPLDVIVITNKPLFTDCAMT